MDFRDSPSEASWRQAVREFVRRELPDRGDPSSMPTWRRKLAERGWIAPAWPKEYGGAGLSIMEQFILNEEFAELRAPSVGGIGVSMVGPTLIVHGNEEQKQEHLPRMLSGEVVWCQGFSEPNAGSDLASLQTRAVRYGDDYLINGQKIWTSGAQLADWMFMLARTDPEAPKHKGISYFLVDMKSPGITVRPIMTMAGTAAFNEVFFENVRVPAHNLVGEENRGWYIGTTTLDFERSSIGNAVGQQQQVERYLRYARAQQAGIPSYRALRGELADRWIEAASARLLSYRVVTLQTQGKVPNYEASMVKLYTSELTQRIARTGMRLVGLAGQVVEESHAPMRGRTPINYLLTIASTIGGGTSEVQRNIIATRGLGLPQS